MGKKREYRNIWREIDEEIYPALVNTSKGRIYGYVNGVGDFLIEPRFSSAYFFNKRGLAIVVENNKFGLINKRGNYVVNPIYDSIGEFKEGRAVTLKESKYGLIDDCGVEIQLNDYSFVGNFSEGRAVVSITNKDYTSLYGYIDLNGKEVVKPQYVLGYNYNEGLALVKEEENKYKLLDLDGKVINSLNYYFLGEVSSKLLPFKLDEGSLYGYIDINGNEVIKPKYKYAESFKNGVAIVSSEFEYSGPYGLIDKRGKEVYSEIFSSIKVLGEKRIALGMLLDDKDKFGRSIYAIGTSQGGKLTDFKYLDVGNYKNGYGYAEDNENIFFINMEGEREKSLPQVKGSGELKRVGNVIYANVDYMPFYLNQNGQIIYEPNKKIYLDNIYSVLMEKYKPNINYLIYYPKVNGMKDKKKQMLINTYLYEASYFTPFGDEESIKKPPTVNDVLNYSYYGDFEINYYKNPILVLKLTGYYYPLGAAHGMPTMKTPTINLETGEIYKLGDLFMGGVYWTGELNKIIEDMIKNGPQKDLVFEDGFKGISVNQSFYVDGENLYIYFPPYDIGPYASGFITFKIPFESINGMINKNGSFYKALMA